MEKISADGETMPVSCKRNEYILDELKELVVVFDLKWL